MTLSPVVAWCKMIKGITYERYKLQWMLDHGYLLTDMVKAVLRHTDTIAGIDFEEAYKLWELESGFNSELWVSYDEWIRNPPDNLNQPKTFNELRVEQGLPVVINKNVSEVFKPVYFCRPYSNWIPVNKELPKEAQHILITIKTDNSYGRGTKIEYAVDVATFHKNDGYLESACGNGFFNTDNDWDEGQPITVVAWMPKPKPYLEKEKKNVETDVN